MHQTIVIDVSSRNGQQKSAIIQLPQRCLSSWIGAYAKPSVLKPSVLRCCQTLQLFLLGVLKESLAVGNSFGNVFHQV